MQQEPEVFERTTTVTILCVVFTLLQLPAFTSLVSDLVSALSALGEEALVFSNQQSAIFMAYELLFRTLIVISYVGLWKMKRWGVYLFLAVASMAFAVAYVTGTLEYSPPGVVVFTVSFMVYVTVVGFNWRFLAGARSEVTRE